MSPDSINILIISHSPAFEELLVQKQGRVVQCTTIASIKQLMLGISRKRPDIIIFDNPNTTDEIESLNEAYHEVPVLSLVQAHGAPSLPGTVLHKPLRASALFQALDTFLLAKESPFSLGSGLYLFMQGRFLADNHSPVSEEGKLRLTEKEAAIIYFLYQQNGVPVSRDLLLSQIWDYNADIDTHTLETHMYRLRQKIAERFGGIDLIKTEPTGYVIIR